MYIHVYRVEHPHAYTIHLNACTVQGTPLTGHETHSSDVEPLVVEVVVVDVDKTEPSDCCLLQCAPAERRALAEDLCLAGVAAVGTRVGLEEGAVEEGEREEGRVQTEKEGVPVVCDWWTEHLHHHSLLHSHHKAGCRSTAVKRPA